MPPQSPNPNPNPIPPINVPNLTADDLRDPDRAASAINSTLLDYGQSINYILGHAGVTPVLKAGADFGGKPATNVGSPLTPSDVVTQEFAANNYGAPALQPLFEALGNKQLQTYRQLNNPAQQERYSSFLNSALSVVPSANTGTISATNVGGSVDVTINGGLHQRLDRSNVPFNSRTDSLPLAASYSITSLSRSGGVVTATLGSAFTGAVGDQIGITGAIATEWQGVFIVGTPILGNVIVYNQSGANDSESGGVLTMIDTYYYTIAHGQNTLGLVSAPAADTWSQRSMASYDGTAIIAVVVVDSSGIDPINSGSGLTSPVSGAAVPVVRRL
jgi:hypothetical protein